MEEKCLNDVDNFIQEKMDAVSKSNSIEFIDTTKIPQCARTCTVPFTGITKSTTNNDGLISSSLCSSSLASPHAQENTISTLNPLEDRMRAIEKHLGFIIEPIDKDLNQRIKILEEKILRIEHQFPQIATNFFNYGQAEIRASLKPGGRISNLHYSNRSTTSSSSKKIKMEPEDLLSVVAEDDLNSTTSEDENEEPAPNAAIEIRKRMSEIKKTLSNNHK